MMITNYIFTSIDIESGAIEHFEAEEDIIESGYCTDNILMCISGLEATYKGKVWFFTEDLMLESVVDVIFKESEEF